MTGLWVVEECRREDWCPVSGPVPADEAAAALRLLRADRPWRRYRLVPAP